jgi:hypothetical protein
MSTRNCHRFGTNDRFYSLLTGEYLKALNLVIYVQIVSRLLKNISAQLS